MSNVDLTLGQNMEVFVGMCSSPYFSELVIEQVCYCASIAVLVVVVVIVVVRKW